MVFPIVMYGCESWAVKNAECQKTDAFELWFWIRLFRVPCGWQGNQNQSILKEINPEYLSEGLMLKLETPILWPPDAKKTDSLERPWCWERLKAGEGDDRGWDGWMASPTQWTWIWASSGRWRRTGRYTSVHGVTKNWTGLSYWTTTRGRECTGNICTFCSILP